MGQRRKWWIGLLPLLALWLGVNKFEIERVEADLATRADAALAPVTGDPGFSVAAGRDVSLNGWIFDESKRPAALAAAAAVPGVRLVADGLIEPPLAKPFLWRAALDGAVLTISGAVSSPRDRASIVAAAKKALPQARIIDRMSYFAGAPPDFVARTEGALQILAHLSAGQAQMRDDDLSLSGQAPTSAEYQAALAQAESAAPVRLDIAAPKAASFGFQAENDGRTLAVSGNIGSEADRASLLEQARKLFPDLAVVDKLQVVAGAPARFADNAGHALGALAQLKTGAASLRDNVTTLSGQARPGMDANSVAASMDGTPGMTLDLKGVEPGEALEAAPPETPAASLQAPDCGAKMADILRVTPIRFEYRRANITPDSAAALDALAAVAQQCPTVAFNVTGHWRNIDLSLRRAEAVVASLVAAGVDRARLTALGSEAGGDSEADGKRIRGVEFNVK